ncbi:hypothetical protein MRB53_028696 [Persea americana]|uniref:Uncharacterized protein n=1 Tax=Persea americana TaxID=3435 RepID=A0ACC2KGL9_PERAE|nr:hypothetical protein MRB53_028696 [Persea americana]
MREVVKSPFVPIPLFLLPSTLFFVEKEKRRNSKTREIREDIGLVDPRKMCTLNASTPALAIPNVSSQGDILRKNSFCNLSVQGLPGKAVSQGGRSIRLVNSSLSIPGLHSQPFQYGRSISDPHRRTSAAVICNAALNARCGAEQTQTVTRQSSTITVAPVQGKEKSPELDDGGTGFPPRDDDGGGGGGGGGGPGWSGGFFFFGLLAFLGFLKDKESEGPYSDNRRRR